MDNNGPSRSESINPSVCDVCKGIFDTQNPRYFVRRPTPGHTRWINMSHPYVHVYVHHADITVLLSSAKAGCALCTFFINQLKYQNPSISTENFKLRSVEADSKAQSVEDVLRAIRLAEHAQQDVSSLTDELDKHPGGREMVTLQLYAEEESGPWWHRRDFGSFVSTPVGLGGFGYFSSSNFMSSFNHLKRAGDSTPVGLGGFGHFSSSNSMSSFNHLKRAEDSIDPKLEHRPSMDLLSEPHTRLINEWRQVCKTEHRSCNQAVFNQTLPSRVLELLDLNDEERGVRLIETHRTLQGTYACLSYCWGDSKTQIGRTTRDNLERQLQGIPFRDLSDTVVDAVRLCYKLGFRFLWIDRLCIVQDNHDDWSEEASRMCEVYSKSALTISVPICVESSQSFLAERRKGFREQSQFLTITHPELEGESKLKSRSWFHNYGLSRRDGPWFLEKNWKEFSSAPNHPGNRWLDRGWTFQEWMLSPRVLHIDSITLWDCFEGYANELARRTMEQARLVRSPREFGGGMSWDAVVQEYSNRKVSREEDRLPALGGLAVRYAQVTGHTYLAGLWLEDLPRSLLWEGLERRGPANQHAPSWSWAYLNGSVYFTSASASFIAEASVSSFFCQYDPPRSLTAVIKAWIDVEGRVTVVTEQIGDEPWNRRIEAGEQWWQARPDHGDRCPDDAIAQGNVYLLLVGSTTSFHNDWLPPTCLALILQRCGSEDGRQCFQRLGVAQVGYEGQGRRSPDYEPSWEARVVRLV